MAGKLRLSASIDAELLTAVEQATKRGAAPTVSAWINDAIRQKLAHDGRLAALGAFIADYEAEHGPITPADTEAAVREAKRRAISVRGLRAGEPRRKYRR